MRSSSSTRAKRDLYDVLRGENKWIASHLQAVTTIPRKEGEKKEDGLSEEHDGDQVGLDLRSDGEKREGKVFRPMNGLPGGGKGEGKVFRAGAGGRRNP